MTDDRSIQPAEHALGLAPGDGPRASADPAFAREVAHWRGRFASLLDEIEPVPAPKALWDRINRSLGGTAGASNVIALRRRVTVWQGMTGAMTALAASLALVVVTREVPPPSPQPSPPPPASPLPAARPMVAMIKAGPEVAAVVSWDSNARSLLVSEVKMPVVPSHDYQLWLIPADGKPRSVGVMPNVPHMQVALAAPMSAMVAEGATLAVSLEPVGGSRTDGPSGPVVASGALAAA